jgi:predicted house-cleaning NTP pyrophosphatase (Maf/HAM1 superfamily)
LKPDIILASSSPFRKSLLERLHLDFHTISPDIDEDHHQGELAEDYVCRLARQKAQAIASQHPLSIIIGSDQCALLDGKILGKPGTH